MRSLCYSELQGYSLDWKIHTCLQIKIGTTLGMWYKEPGIHMLLHPRGIFKCVPPVTCVPWIMTSFVDKNHDTSKGKGTPLLGLQGPHWLNPLAAKGFAQPWW